MMDTPKYAGRETTGAVPPGTAAALEADRAFLLECRIEQLRAAVVEARAEADRARTRLAEAAAREADRARREAQLHEELAAAREEVASLHRRLEQSEALRAELEGHLFEAGAREDAEELVRLRREVAAERERADANERTVAYLRNRVDDLVTTRETLLTRVVEWQRLVRQGDDEAIDLAEFIAGLRGDILQLEHHNAQLEHHNAELEHHGAAAERREARDSALLGEVGEPAASATEATEAAREAAAEADEASAAGETAPVVAEKPPVVVDDAPAAPDAAPARGRSSDDVASALASAQSPDLQIRLLLQVGRSRKAGSPDAIRAVQRLTAASEPRVRAASYEALGRLLEQDPVRLERHLEAGLADPDPRVRRRVVLAAATARGLALGPLLEPLETDADPQVRRVARQVLRTAQAAVPEPVKGTTLTHTGVPAGIPSGAAS
ncbi:MAG TPA: hypothetical protein VFQ22_06460 [Longimicrobiales bacterium]|nr:hypothetical protein [Longimicrobiales bacterium]